MVGRTATTHPLQLRMMNRGSYLATRCARNHSTDGVIARNTGLIAPLIHHDAFGR